MLAKAQGDRHDSTVVKIDSSHSPRGPQGEKYLASGVRVAMRLWEEERPGLGVESERSYEVVGFVLSGRAELHIEGQVVKLNAGDSYVVPRGARHAYRILEPFSAVEATSPPCHVHARDELPGEAPRTAHATSAPTRTAEGTEPRKVVSAGAGGADPRDDGIPFAISEDPPESDEVPD